MDDRNTAPQDDPLLSPSSFVEHIRELGEKRDREDQERNRLLEEQILQGRAERAARRAERQRSLSPEKSAQPSSPVVSDKEESPSPASMDAHGDALQRLTGAAPDAQGDETPTPAKASPATPSTPTRSGTLSWQQRRPNSSSGRRPLSQIAAENSAARSPNATPEPSTPADDTASRAQISQSLGAKDPSWFRQTPDRGIGSAAYRRSREDISGEAGTRQLPGMARDSVAESAASPPSESVRSNSPSRASSARGSAAWSNRLSRDTSVSGYSASDVKSPLPTLESQKFRPPTELDGNEHGPSERGYAMSPSQGRISPERTPSPTKGMGGFVQSAMMKRSDSVSKRWSVQTGGGLSRQNSTASNVGTVPPLDPRPSGDSGERPGSSHSNATEKAAGAGDSFARPTLSLRHSRGKSVSSISQLEENRSDVSSPSSPTKRWSRSPTKSSWLESALSAKPDSPKPQPQPQQPSWMAEISKIKAQKASVDLSKSEKPDTSAPSSPTKFPRGDALRGSESRGSAQGAVAQSPDVVRGPPEEITDREQHPAPESAEHTSSSPQAKPATLSSPNMEAAKEPAASPALDSPTAKADKPAVGAKSPGLRGPPASKPEEPPKPDFRAGLKHRTRQSENPKGGEVAEFQNVFGKLKKTNTEKFVAPDTFKDNIVRGKAGLNLTGGVPPRVKKDELRDSLVKQRESIKAKAQETGVHSRTGSRAAPMEATPEALQKRKNLGRTDSVSKVSSESTKEESGAAVPEALARRGTLGRTESPSKTPSSPAKEEAPAPEAAEKPKNLQDRKLTDPPKPDPAELEKSEKKAESPTKPTATTPVEKIEKKAESPTKPTATSPVEKTEKEAEAPSKPAFSKPATTTPGKLADRFKPAVDNKDTTSPAKPPTRPVGKLADRFNPPGLAKPANEKEKDAPPKITGRVPGKLSDRFNAASEPSKPASSDKEADVPGKLSNRASGKLADRFNPGLAAMLARGPGTSGSGASGSSTPSSTAVEPEPGTTKELTHITKGRARGPKRRAPKGKNEATTSPEPATEIASPTPVRKASVVNVPLVKPQNILPSSPPAASTKDDKPTESPRASPGPESKPKPVAPAKSAEVSRRVSAKLDSPTEPAVPAKSPELSRRISAKFEKDSNPPSPAAKSPDLSKRISAKFEQRKSPPPEPSTPKPLDLSKKASGKFDSHQSTVELDFSTAAKVDSPTKVDSPSAKVASPTKETPAKPSSPVKVESPFKPASPVKDETPAKPSAPAKIDLPARVASPIKTKPDSPTKVDSPKAESPSKTGFGAKSDIAARIAALKQGSDQTVSSQPGSPKPLFSGASRFNKENKSPTSPSSPSPQTPTAVESPKHKPLPTPPPGADDAKPPPIPAKDVPPKPEAGSSSVKSAAATWGRPLDSSSDTPRVKSPVKLPTRKDEQTAMENAGLVRTESPKAAVGLGIGNLSDNKENRSPSPARIDKDLPAAPSKTPLSPPSTQAAPPKPAKKSDSISAPRKVSQDSPIPQQSEAGQLFADFFDDAPVTTGKLDVDAHAILTANPLGAERIKTVRKEIQEITGDGKLNPVPSQEEHILFDNSMYLCTHVFGTPNGAKNTEVYLWAGSSVPEPTIEDAQLFARKAARDAGGKLLIIRQGKETPNLFQALGGILVTRKGTRTDHEKQYMLCGRQHLGHMAFDEVELSLKSLCSGFPYLISSRTGLLSGKIFLWKGKGCSAEELGCARLIGMDLGLTPEIEEIEEGKEHAAFFDIFPAPENGKEKKVPRSADHWRLKSNHDKYSVRLFRIDEKAVQSGGSFQVSSLWPASLMRRVSSQSTQSQGPTSPTDSSSPQNTTPKPNMTAEVVEIAPFSQADLEAENIYVLDAFFEIYIVVGALSSGQSHAFSTALLFAQEYGILAASMQDRPFIPVSTVVLEGVPRDMKAVFRGWQDKMQPTSALMSGKPRRGKSLRIVGLQAAIAATRADNAAKA